MDFSFILKLLFVCIYFLFLILMQWCWCWEAVSIAFPKTTLINFTIILSNAAMSLLSDLVNLNLSDSTKQIIAEYIWSHYLCFLLWLWSKSFFAINLFLCFDVYIIKLVTFFVVCLLGFWYFRMDCEWTGLVDLEWTLEVKPG